MYEANVAVWLLNTPRTARDIEQAIWLIKEGRIVINHEDKLANLNDHIPKPKSIEMYSEKPTWIKQ